MRTILVTLSLPLLFTSFLNAQSLDGGQTGLAFLKLGVGGRASAMGEAYSAVADEATATYWNPAGLALVHRMQLAFTHTEWIQDVTNEYLALVFPGLGGSVGFSFHSNNVGGIEHRVKPSEEPIGTVDANDIAFGLSYGRPFGDNLNGGFTVKYLYEKIFIASVAGFAFDFGLQFKPFEENLTLAFAAQNIGSMGTLVEESIELPTTVRFGIAYRFPLEALNAQLLIAADGVKVRNGDLHGNFGAELKLSNHLAFRFGYQTGFEEKSVGGGFGFLFNRYHLDYGFTPFDSNLGDTHRFSFGLDL